MEQICWSIDEKMGQTYVYCDLANTLAQRDYKQPQAVLVIRDDRICYAADRAVDRINKCFNPGTERLQVHKESNNGG